MSKLTVCANCFEVIPLESKKCKFCGSANELYKHEELLQELVSGYFFAYQTRLSIEEFVEKHGDQYRPQFSHIGPNEIFGFIFLAVLSGATHDVIKALIKKIYSSAVEQGIRIQSEFLQTEFPSSDEKLLRNLIDDEEEIRQLVRYIREYQYEYKDADVHKFVIEEAVFLQDELSESQEFLMSRIKSNLSNLEKQEASSNDEASQ